MSDNHTHTHRNHTRTWGAFVLGILLCIGLLGLGAVLGNSALRYREFERTVVVKGLSEREYPANVVIWPLEFTAADNDLAALYEQLERNTVLVRTFLINSGLSADEISYNAPLVTDGYANQYGENERRFRYTGSRALTVYTDKVELVREAMANLGQLGREGLTMSPDTWRTMPQYLFTTLNDVKPEMIEEATRNAREVAEKFAADSQSRLGKIKNASQGTFTITDRDANNPHIKTVRVVSTIEYYLAD
jgi:Uncharacterized protein conserved in bacteria